MLVGLNLGRAADKGIIDILPSEREVSHAEEIEAG